MMEKPKFITPCIIIITFTLFAMSWHAPVNSDIPGTTGGIHAQGSGYMTSTSTLVDSCHVLAARGAKGYYTVNGNSCDIEMNVYIYSSQDYSRYTAGQNVTPYRTFRTSPSRRWSFIAPASDTWYFMYRPATAFNGSIYVSSLIQADTSGPAISTNLQNLLVINSSFTIQANATDLFQVSYIGIEINGDPKAEVFNSTTISYAWTPDPNLEQMNTVKLTTWDQFCQVREYSYFIVGADRTCPVVTWNSPPTTASGSVYLYISYSDNVALKRFKILMNGSQLYNEEYSSSSSFYTGDYVSYSWNTLAVANGPVMLTAIVWDQKGLNTTSSITVTVNNDRTPPSLSWITTSITLSGSNVPIVVSVSDDHLVSRVELRVNGSAYGNTYPNSQSASTTFNFNSLSYSNGMVKLEVVAYDSAGNSNSISKNFTIDNDHMPPTITWVMNSTTLSGSSVPIIVSVSDDHKVKQVGLYINDNSYDLSYPNSQSAIVTFNFNSLSYWNGQILMKVIAYDSAGNSKTISKYFTIDNDYTSPTASWQSVPYDASGTVDIPVLVSDNVAISWVEFYANDYNLISTIRSPANNAVVHFSLDTTRYSNGNLDLKVVVCDTSGHQTTIYKNVHVSNNGSSTTTTSSNNTNAAGATAAICVVILLFSFVAAMVAKTKKKNATNASTSFTPSSTTSRASRPAIPVQSSTRSPPSTASSTGSRPSATTSSSRRPASRALARPNLPASCFVPNKQWEVVEGIRTRRPDPFSPRNALPAETKKDDMVTPWINHVIAPKVSRMYMDGACFNNITVRNDASSISIQASKPTLFCKICNAPVVPDQDDSSNPATCKNCGSVLVQLVPIASITRAKFVHADADYRVFVDVMSWIIAKQAIPAMGILNKARLKIILNHTGHGDVDSRHFIDKMLKTRLFAAETEKTIVLSKTIVECTSLDSLLIYLSEYLRNM